MELGSGLNNPFKKLLQNTETEEDGFIHFFKIQAPREMRNKYTQWYQVNTAH